MAMPRLALLVCLLSLVPLSGCVSVASLQDWQYAHVNKKRAREAWKNCYSHPQRADLGNDFEGGFKTGYFDTATGKGCGLPAVAPPKYWAAKYQCCSGQTCIQDWFKGYQCGITAAERCGYPDFHELSTSACAPVINRTACGKCYAPDCQGDCGCTQPYDFQPSAFAVPRYDASRDIESHNHSVEPAPSQDSESVPVFPSEIRPASFGIIGPIDALTIPASFSR